MTKSESSDASSRVSGVEELLLSVLPRSADEEQLLAYCGLAVAYADGDAELARRNFVKRSIPVAGESKAAWESIVDSLESGSSGWRALLCDQIDGSVMNVVVLGYTLSTMNPLMTPDKLENSRVQNRVGTILDALDCKFTAADALMVRQGATDALAEASTSGAVRTSVLGGSVAAGAIAGWFGLYGSASKAIAWAGNFVTAALTPESDFVVNLGAVVGLTLLMWDDGQHENVHRIRAGLSTLLLEARQEASDHQGSTTGEVDSALRARVLNKAIELLIPDEAADLSALQQADFPNVVGMTVSEAETVIKSYGGETQKVFDSVKPGGEERWILQKKKWIVVRQYNAHRRKESGSFTVVLYARKDSDPT